MKGVIIIDGTLSFHATHQIQVTISILAIPTIELESLFYIIVEVVMVVARNRTAIITSHQI